MKKTNWIPSASNLTWLFPICLWSVPSVNKFQRSRLCRQSLVAYLRGASSQNTSANMVKIQLQMKLSRKVNWSKSNHHQVAKPKLSSVSSIPTILAQLRDEWDACMLDSFELKQQLMTTRQELSHALYQLDASYRVIARLKGQVDELQIKLQDQNESEEQWCRWQAAVGCVRKKTSKRFQHGLTCVVNKKHCALKSSR